LINLKVHILKVSLGRLFVAMFLPDPMRIPCSRDNLNIGLIKGPHVDAVQLSKKIKYSRIPYEPGCMFTGKYSERFSKRSPT
jgi:hypothetical protein